jgi:hypothetical protein
MTIRPRALLFAAILCYSVCAIAAPPGDTSDASDSEQEAYSELDEDELDDGIFAKETPLSSETAEKTNELEERLNKHSLALDRFAAKPSIYPTSFAEEACAILTANVVGTSEFFNGLNGLTTEALEMINAKINRIDYDHRRLLKGLEGRYKSKAHYAATQALRYLALICLQNPSPSFHKNYWFDFVWQTLQTEPEDLWAQDLTTHLECAKEASRWATESSKAAATDAHANFLDAVNRAKALEVSSETT